MSEEITNNEEETVPSPYEGLVDQIHDVDLDEIPLLVVKNGKKTLLRLGLNIEDKIKDYLDNSGLLDDIKGLKEELEALKENIEDLDKLKEQLDELKEKLEELEENGVGGSTGDSDSYGKRKLADCTWAEIKEIADSGMASEVFEIGDTKDINTANGVRTITIMHFYHPECTDFSGNPLPIQFGTKFAGYKKYTRSSPTYASDSYSQELEAIYDSFDDEVKSVISLMNIAYAHQGIYQSQSTLVRSTVTFTGYAGRLVALRATWCLKGENTIFDYYLNSGSWGGLQISDNGTGSLVAYWLGGANGSAQCYFSLSGGWGSTTSTTTEYSDMFVFSV